MARPIRGARDLKTTQDQLHSIDDQITKLWIAYRKWFQGEHTALSPVDAREAIDHLLETRHNITLAALGEMANPADIASVTEWGALGEGTSP